MPEVSWKVDSEKTSREDVDEILNQIEKEVEQQTGESIQVYESEELEPGTGALLIDFLIYASSGAVARAIYDALKGRKETEDLDIDVNVSGNGDTEVEINIDK